MSDSPAFVAPASIPVQEAPHGIRFDFNHGARVHLPPGDWQVRLSDARTHNTLFDTRLAEGWVTSSKRYFVPFRIEVWQAGQLVFTHRLDLAGQDVLVQFPVGTLGDVLGWFPYAARFAGQHGCRPAQQGRHHEPDADRAQVEQHGRRQHGFERAAHGKAFVGAVGVADVSGTAHHARDAARGQEKQLAARLLREGVAVPGRHG